MDAIKTERLLLKPLVSDYAPLLLPIWSDSDVIKFTYIQGITDIESCKKRIEPLVKSREEGNITGPYVIFCGSELIGAAGAGRVSAFEYSLFYHLGKEYWGKGYTSEAARAILDAVFQNPEIVRVSADAVTENPASVRVLEKLGMTREGCMRMKFFRDGKYYDSYLYSILRSEHLNKKG